MVSSMNRPKLLDLYCGEGGAGMGYALAGFDVIGFDIHRQPRFPFPFVQMDVLKIDQRWLDWADYIHASPPCQGLTEMNNDKSRHLNLIPQTRAILQRSGKPYVIENVRGARAHLINPVSLTGLMFGNRMTTSKGQVFELSRERLFETNWGAEPQPSWEQHYPLANVYGGHLRARSGDYRTGKGTGKTRDFIGEDKPALARELFDMPWATLKGISESVPPSYTHHLGEEMLRRNRSSLRKAA
jgi:DNA (cytosine-5)-methyltransferase 1